MKNISSGISDKRSRNVWIRLAGLVGIGVNVLFAGIKLTVGVLGNSVSILSDAVNNLTDALSSLITLIGLKLSGKKPDRDHPLGHGRIEYISGLVVAVLVLAAGIEFTWSSGKRILYPEETDLSLTALWILGVTVVGKCLLCVMDIRIGKATGSQALEAAGAEARMDVFASLLTIVGALLSRYTGWMVDGYIGIVLSLFILHTGYTLLRSTLSTIIGERPDKELAKALTEDVLQFEPILGAHDLVLHNYGPSTCLGSLNVELADEITVETAYQAMSSAQQYFIDKYGIYFTFGLYSVNTYDEEIRRMRDAVSRIICEMPGAISIHGFKYEKEENIVRFDTVVEYALQNYDAFRQEAVAELHKIYPSITFLINIDLD